MTPEEFIKDCTRGCCNELVAVEDKDGKRVISYHEWLTPDQALRAVEMAREETRQQMMAKAVERTVKVDAGGYPYIDTTELYDYDKDEPLAKEGDNVKIIIVKED